jgi:hypothetical protein
VKSSRYADPQKIELPFSRPIPPKLKCFFLDWKKALTQPTQKIEMAQTTMNEYRQQIRENIPRWIEMIKRTEHDLQKQTLMLAMRVGVAIVREGDVYTEYQKAKEFSEVSLGAIDELSDDSEINEGNYLFYMNKMKEFREDVDDMWRCYLILMLDEDKGKERKE